MKAVQKIVRNGNSAQITIPRQLLFELGLRPGDLIELSSDGSGLVSFRAWANREYANTRSPGVMPDVPLPMKP